MTPGGAPGFRRCCCANPRLTLLVACCLSVQHYVESEILNHSTLRHPHVVQFREVFLSPNHVSLCSRRTSSTLLTAVMEPMPCVGAQTAPQKHAVTLLFPGLGLQPAQSVVCWLHQPSRLHACAARCCCCRLLCRNADQHCHGLCFRRQLVHICADTQQAEGALGQVSNLHPRPRCRQRAAKEEHHPMHSCLLHHRAHTGLSSRLATSH